MRLHKVLLLSFIICTSSLFLKTSWQSEVVAKDLINTNVLLTDNNSVSFFTTGYFSLKIKMINNSKHNSELIIANKMLLINDNFLAASVPLYIYKQKYYPNLIGQTQSARMRCALKDKEVTEIVNSLRNDSQKIYDKYNKSTLLLKNAPSDEALQEKVNQLGLHNKDTLNLNKELDVFLAGNIDETSDKIKEILLTTLSEYKTQLDIIFTNASLIDLDTNLYHGIEGVTKDRVLIAEAGLSLLNKIPYEWGGKATDGGWNNRWNTEGKGLDCSGFVEWVYWTICGKSNKDLRSTLTIANSQKLISREELKIGDLGMIYPTGTRYADYAGNIFYSESKAKKSNLAAGISEENIEILYNHVGIFVGKDMNGTDLWVHCTGDPFNTVVVSTYEKFTYYYKMPK